MHIFVKSVDYRDIHLCLPSRLLLNPVGALPAPRFLKKNGMEITYAQALKLASTLNRYRKKHPEWVVIEAQTNDGASVEIKI